MTSTIEPSQETPYSNGTGLAIGSSNNNDNEEAKIILSDWRLRREYGIRTCCWCCETPQYHILKKPDLLQKQGVPDELWDSFTSDFHREMSSFQRLNIMFVLFVFIVWLHDHFMKNRSDSDASSSSSSNSSASSDGWIALDIIIIVGACLLGFAIAVTILLLIEIVGDRVWTFFITRRVAQLTERWQTQFNDYGLELSFDVTVQSAMERLRGFHLIGRSRGISILWKRSSTEPYTPMTSTGATHPIV